MALHRGRVQITGPDRRGIGAPVRRADRRWVARAPIAGDMLQLRRHEKAESRQSVIGAAWLGFADDRHFRSGTAEARLPTAGQLSIPIQCATLRNVEVERRSAWAKVMTVSRARGWCRTC